MRHRTTNLCLLHDLGFRVASSLPVQRRDGSTQLRAADEILGRALALRTVCFWVATDEEMIPSAKILAGIDSHNLKAHFTHADQEILDLSREDAQEEHIGTIGWRLENIWPLVWILGFEAQPTLRGMIDDSLIPELLTHFPKFEESTTSFLTAGHVRSVIEVDALEDLFYCVHNAVHSAQLGENTVPNDFDPIAEGGVIHERRHALTWALSPGVAWDDTDLST